MDEQGINSAVNGLASAISNADEQGISAHAIVLLGGVLLDLNRVANAVEKLSKFEITKVGEILQAGVPEGAHEISLTMAEYQTVMALRAGEVQVVMVSVSRADDERVAKFRRDYLGSHAHGWDTLDEETKNGWRERFQLEHAKGEV